MLYRIGIFLMIVMVFTGCTKEFDLQSNLLTPTIVIEGRVSNMQGPYYVRVTRADQHLFKHLGFRGDSAIAVTNAVVVIEDDQGVKDTLVPSKENNPERYEYDSWSKNDFKLDSVLKPFRTELLVGRRGYYETTKLKGEPGHTYKLTVNVNDTIYQASAYMPPVVELDSAALLGIPAEGTINGFSNEPFVWFKEPKETKNYYRFQYNLLKHFRYDEAIESELRNKELTYSFLDDDLLPATVSRLQIYGIWPDTYKHTRHNTLAMMKGSIQVRLYSITKETYDYFNILVKQYQADGNVYKTAPTTPKTNISNGGLGFFYAASASVRQANVESWRPI